MLGARCLSGRAHGCLSSDAPGHPRLETERGPDPKSDGEPGLMSVPRPAGATPGPALAEGARTAWEIEGRNAFSGPYQNENDIRSGGHYIPGDKRTPSGLVAGTATGMSRAGRGSKVLVRPWGGWFMPRDHSALPRSFIFPSLLASSDPPSQAAPAEVPSSPTSPRVPISGPRALSERRDQPPLALSGERLRAELRQTRSLCSVDPGSGSGYGSAPCA